MSAPHAPLPPFSLALLPGSLHPRWGRSPVDCASTFRLASHSPEECWDRLRPRPLPSHPRGRGHLPHPHCVPGSLCKGQSGTPLGLGCVVHVGSDSPRVSLTQKVCFEPLCPMGSLKRKMLDDFSHSSRVNFSVLTFQIKPLRGELGLPCPIQAPPGLAADTYRMGLSCCRKPSSLLAVLALFLPGVSHAACPVGNRLNE